jgi:DNA polymerase III delta subunit
MIYLFYGSDTEKARKKWRGVLEAFEKKYPEGNIFRFDTEHFDAAQFEELIASRDIFGGKRLVACDHCLENVEVADFISKKLAALQDSPHVFAFLERDLKAAEQKKFEKAGAKLEECKKLVPRSFGEVGDFNVFALTDALLERDRKRLWILYQEALERRIAEEEIFWKLVWQTKMLLLVRHAGAKKLTSVKDFVAGKARRGNQNYKDGELEKLSGELVALWHESKEEQGRDFAMGLERLILNI